MPDITYVQFTDPTAYPPLEHSALLLQARGWNVRFLGVKWPDSAEFKFSSRLQADLNLLTSPGAGWKQKIFFVKFIGWITLECMRNRSEWIYVSDPMAAPVGLVLKWLGFKVCYHEHDSPSGKARSGFEFLIRLCRHQLARKANFNVLPQDMRCQLFKKETGTIKPVLRVWNCPRYDEARYKPRRPRQASEPLGIYYHGSISLTRIPLSLIEAAGTCGLPIAIRIIGYETLGSHGACESLKRVAELYRHSLRLEIGGPRSRQQLFESMESMHLGWVAYSEQDIDVNLRHLAGASNKAFDYLASGLALITNQDEEWLRLFHNEGLGYTCNPENIRSIQSALCSAFQSPCDTQQMGEAGRKKVKDTWNYENEFNKVLLQMSKYSNSKEKIRNYI